MAALLRRTLVRLDRRWDNTKGKIKSITLKSILQPSAYLLKLSCISMKFPIAYYTMLLYLTVMFRPLIPLMEDAIAHEFSDAEHIATVHAKFGNNHVEIALAAQANDANGKEQNTIKEETQVPVHITVNEADNIGIAGNKKIIYPILQYNHPINIFISFPTPPPKIAALLC